MPDFNFQQSNSPLLNAIVQQPQDMAKLKILQEQNQRARLSDMLTNISNAAATARQIQLIHQARFQQQGREKLAQAAGQGSPLAGAAAQADPDAYAQGVAGVTAPFQGMDSMMAPSQSASNPTQNSSQPSLQGEGVTPNDQNIPSRSSGQSTQTPGGALETRKAAIMNRIVPLGYELSTDPETGNRQLVSKIPGVPIIPIDSQDSPRGGLKTDPNTLNPVERKAIPEFAAKFAEDSKPEQQVLLNVKEFKNLALMKNPISDTTIKLLTPKLTGIVARLNPATLDAYGGSPAVLDKIKAGLQRAKEGTLTDSDRSFMVNFANTIETSANGALQQKLGDSVSRAQITIPGVHPSLLNQAIGGDIQKRISAYKPLVQPPAMTKIQASDGSIHMVPSSNLSKARKLDAGLKVIQ